MTWWENLFRLKIRGFTYVFVSNSEDENTMTQGKLDGLVSNFLGTRGICYLNFVSMWLIQITF